MKTIILAGGKGTRLPISGADKPKILVEVAGKTILDRQIEWLKKHNLTDIGLCLGFRAEQIIKYIENSPTFSDINIDYVVESTPLGTGGAIKSALNGLKNDFLALNGDILTDADLTKFINCYQDIKSMEDRPPQLTQNTTPKKIYCVPRGTPHQSLRSGTRQAFSASILAWKCQNACDFGLLEVENDKIRAFREKQGEIKCGFINAGVYILSPEIFVDFKAGDSFSIEKDVFPKLAAAGKLKTRIFDGFWTDLGTEERLEEARKFFS